MDNKSNGNKASGKFAETVGRATGGKPGDDEGAVVLSKEAKAMISKPTQEQINAMMADENLEFAPQVHTLEEGELISGILEGEGPGTQFTQKDPLTAVEITRPVKTWIIRNQDSGMRLSILSSTQLDDKLPPFKGSLVSIYRGKETKTQKGFRVTNYVVSGPRLEGGKVRDFTKKRLPIDAESVELPAGHVAAQLAAGQPDGEDAVA